MISEMMDFGQAVKASAVGIKLEVLHASWWGPYTLRPEMQAPWWEPFTLRPEMHVVVWMLSATFRVAQDWPDCGCKERGAGPLHVHPYEAE